MKLIFIVNETAGKGQKTWAALQAQLTIPYEVYKTAYATHATALVQELAQQHDQLCIIAVGGDGTVHEVIQGALGKQVIIGVVSAGSGNDFARAFPTFKQAAHIETWYATQQTKCYDIGKFTDNAIFMNNAGIGFDAYVVALANASRIKKRFNQLGLGKLAYVYYLVKALFTYSTQNISVNGQLYRNVWFVTISNQPYFGGGMKISPHSKTDDDMLECTIVHNLSKRKLLTVFMTVFWGGHTRFKEVTQLNGQQFKLTVPQAIHCHIDGEAFHITEHDVHVYVQPRSWQLAQITEMRNDIEITL